MEFNLNGWKVLSFIAPPFSEVRNDYKLVQLDLTNIPADLLQI